MAITGWLKAYLENLVTLIDPNFYFFANHPHERVGVIETERFWFGFLPLFALGLLTLGQKRWFLWPLLGAVLLGASLGLTLGPLLVYPFIIAALLQGLVWVGIKLKPYVRR